MSKEHKLPALAALRAKPFQQIVGRIDEKALRCRHRGQGHVGKTERAPAVLTEKVGMKVIVDSVVVAVTQLIACAARPVVDDMDKMMFAEKCKGTEDARLVDRHNTTLQLHERQGPPALVEGTHHDKAVGRRLYAVGQE